jgi:hypothetical protein
MLTRVRDAACSKRKRPDAEELTQSTSGLVCELRSFVGVDQERVISVPMVVDSLLLSGHDIQLARAEQPLPDLARRFFELMCQPFRLALIAVSRLLAEPG